jgi:hypothetical protein
MFIPDPIEATKDEGEKVFVLPTNIKKFEKI